MFSFIRPLLFQFDAERAHGFTIAALDLWGAVRTPFARENSLPILANRVAGLDFANPLGLAAGADKDGRAIDGFLGLGFGCVEIGTLTPLPQSGNPRPRLFRLAADRAVINRMGFNNGGIDAALARASRRRRPGVLGINVGANKESTNRIADYAVGVARVAPIADYITINISSPNTPGLRDLQHGAALDDLLAASDAARRGPARVTPLFLKIAPDLDAAAIDGIARAAATHHIDALIVSNTTVARPGGLRSAMAGEAGGLSGVPLAPLARAQLCAVRAATGGTIPLVSVGGIDSAAEAYARIRGGAALVQLYSALVYAGPGLARRMAVDLAALIAADGFATMAEAIGTG